MGTVTRAATLHVATRAREELIDVTGRVQGLVEASGVRDGLCHVYSPHTTCGVTVQEGWDPAVARDVVTVLARLVPKEASYAHAEGNSDAHVKTMLVGTGATLPVAEGRLRLGRWQAVFLCEFDGPRQRELWVTVMGDGAGG
ncbi:MAG TPA: secondary thiamine-phosphate synthase enzyme YjbQ [Candidatus Dormibacteraeota bacterium]|nr:secondary thiamine-phosphate synthase enzyme YjbQ [Candidatus Dormibacteraeota bacterium]